MKRLQRRLKHSDGIILHVDVTLSIILLILSLLTGAFSGPGGGDTKSETIVASESVGSSKVLAGRTIVLDPGHGGVNPGAVGVGPTTESMNVLAIAYDLKGMLEHAGAKVILTRSTDVDPGEGKLHQLAARVKVANESDADIFVSIHNDSAPNPSVTGTTTFYYGDAGRKLAERVHEATVGVLKTKDRGVKFEEFYVLKHTRMPATLVEVGFVSNYDEAVKLSTPEYRYEAARGIFYGIVRYFAVG